MAHVTPPAHLRDFARFTAFDLGLEVDEEVYVIERTGQEKVFVNWARWRGRIIIARLKQVPAYDNTKAIEQDVQTWFDAIQGRANTTDVPLVEPTIRLPDGPWVPTVALPVIEDGFLKISVDERGVANAVEKRQGDVLKLGNPKRMYKLWRISGADWYLTPGVLPYGTQGADAQSVSLRIPAPATSLRVKITTQLTQVRRKSGRGGWEANFIESFQ